MKVLGGAMLVFKLPCAGVSPSAFPNRIPRAGYAA